MKQNNEFVWTETGFVRVFPCFDNSGEWLFWVDAQNNPVTQRLDTVNEVGTWEV